MRRNGFSTGFARVLVCSLWALTMTLGQQTKTFALFETRDECIAMRAEVKAAHAREGMVLPMQCVLVTR